MNFILSSYYKNYIFCNFKLYYIIYIEGIEYNRIIQIYSIDCGVNIKKNIYLVFFN